MRDLLSVPKLIFSGDTRRAGLYAGFYYSHNPKLGRIPDLSVNSFTSAYPGSPATADQPETFYFYPQLFTFYPILVFSGNHDRLRFGISTDPADKNYLCAVTSAMTVNRGCPVVCALEVNAAFINRWNELEAVLPSFLEFWKNAQSGFPSWWQPPSRELLDARRGMTGTALSLMPLLLPLPLRQYIHAPGETARFKIAAEPAWISMRNNQPFVCLQDLDIYSFTRVWRPGIVGAWGTGIWLTEEIFDALQQLSESIFDAVMPGGIERMPTELSNFLASQSAAGI